MPHLITALGPMRAEALGVILPHEHVFVDLRTWDKPGYGDGQAEDVIALMGPEIRRAREAGVTALVDCGPVGVGRRADILKAVSQAVNFPIVVPTGVYREPWIPPWVQQASEESLRDWMLGELENEIDERDAVTGAATGLRVPGLKAGFIKLSAGDEGITTTEARVLRAAAHAGAATGAAIGSHTIRGRVVRDQLDILEKEGYPPDRFIWIHTQAEPDVHLHLEIARRGAWLEYDAIGNPADDSQYIAWIQQLMEAGFVSRILLSHDRGWYDPAQPGGGKPQPYTYLTSSFLPKLRAAGISEAEIDQLTHSNPFNAFAREATSSRAEKSLS